MRALFSSIYGVAAYLVSMSTLLYFAGFSANVGVPKSVDSGPGAPWAVAVGTDVLLLLLFGVQHSVMARQRFKRWWTRTVPPAVERSTYIVATSLVLGLLCWAWVPIATPVVWHVAPRGAAALLWGLHALGWVLAVASTYLINHYELFGLQQSSAPLRRRSTTESRFATPLLYRCVRHPLYAGFLLTFWSVPVMTAGRLLFALGLSAYVLIGIRLEERDLLQRFGATYRRYRQRVGMLLPRLGPAPAPEPAETASPTLPR